MDKQTVLDNLYDDYINIFKGYSVVTGRGNVNAGLLLIGEAPGRDEVKKNLPFVGAAGKNLTLFLDSIGVSREDIYITNSIKYRLCKLSERTGRFVNAPAKRPDIEANRDYLLREIEIIRPGIIVTLGNVPLKSVTGDFSINIGDVHGSLLDIRIFSSKEGELDFKLFPLYHPASIIYNRSLQDVCLEDMKKLKDIYCRNAG